MAERVSAETSRRRPAHLRQRAVDECRHRKARRPSPLSSDPTPRSWQECACWMIRVVNPNRMGGSSASRPRPARIRRVAMGRAPEPFDQGQRLRPPRDCVAEGCPPPSKPVEVRSLPPRYRAYRDAVPDAERIGRARQPSRSVDLRDPQAYHGRRITFQAYSPNDPSPNLGESTSPKPKQTARQAPTRSETTHDQTCLWHNQYDLRPHPSGPLR